MNTPRRLWVAIACVSVSSGFPPRSHGREDPPRPLLPPTPSGHVGGNTPSLPTIPREFSPYSDLLAPTSAGLPVPGIPDPSYRRMPFVGPFREDAVVATAVAAEHFASQWDVKDAVEVYGLKIKVNPGDPIARYGRGVALLRAKDYEGAVADFSHAIEIDPTAPDTYYQRATAWRALSNVDKAIEDYSEFLRRAGARIARLSEGSKGAAPGANSDRFEVSRLEARQSAAYVDRGRIYRALGDFARASDDFERATRVGPENPRALAMRAWFLATCPEAKYRDGRAAVAAARRARELGRGETFAFLSTLAAAHAESGDFPEAIRLQRRASRLASEAQVPSAKTLMLCFLTRRPVREPARVDVLNGQDVRLFLGLGFEGTRAYATLAFTMAPAIRFYLCPGRPPAIHWYAANGF